ncbi:MAG TPA: hypothetical protein VN151_14325, partial [Terracidiphilus sp.]|nr:hypothetical protein [Terracidiphilus sp.]
RERGAGGPGHGEMAVVGGIEAAAEEGDAHGPIVGQGSGIGKQRSVFVVAGTACSVRLAVRSRGCCG